MIGGIDREVRRLAAQVHGGTLVDIGCGMRPYEDAFDVERYVGIDLEVSGRPASMKRPDMYYDGRNLPFEDASVDHLLCTQALQHVLDPLAFFCECRRVLRPGGDLILSVPQSEPATEKPYDLIRLTRDGLVAMCGEASFDVLSLEPAVGYWQTHAYDVNYLVARKLIKLGAVGKVALSGFGFVTQSVAAALDLGTRYSGNTNTWVLMARAR